MSVDHGPIDELLAGYALGALSGNDAAAADELLDRHVPECDRCQETLHAFTDLMADLALSSTPMTPPDTALPRIHRELERRRPSRRWGMAGIAGVAASFVLLLVIGGMALSGGDVDPSLSKASLQDALRAAQAPGAAVQDVGRAQMVAAPGADQVYVYGTDVPPAPAGTTYRLWATIDGGDVFLGEFAPEAGVVALLVEASPTRVQALWVTVEPAAASPGAAPASPW